MIRPRISLFRFPSIVLALFLCAGSAFAADVTATFYWDKNLEPDIAGYRLHYGTIENPFTDVVDVATNSANISKLVAGTTYLVAVTAYDTAGVESDYSSPIAYVATALPPGPQQVTLENISSRISVQDGDNVMIGGFIVQGSTPKTLALRALGPSLANAGVTDVLSDPVLDLRDATGALIATNDSWNEADAQSLSAFGLAPTDSREAALIVTLPAGTYSAVVHGKGSHRGVALFELYNLDHTQGSVANISTRGLVQTGDQVMIGGFIVGGTTPTKVIVRAIGPSLVAAGVPDALLDPTIELYDSEGTLLDANDNWRSDQATAIVASTIPPTDDREAAIVRTLVPGAYSAIVRGANNTTGVALFEAYSLAQ
ncbi:MAG: fibronectin type III domain-containing protein [Chthoniobacterales bacterium]|nr:fibronectin type III domain-containing protein [Chthoniobacterales bacterium]